MKHILVVDDEQELCSLIKKCLEKTGEYEVTTTSLPESVKDLCLRNKPDLVLLDIVMPNMDGTELIKTLRENPYTRDILIVVTSGMGEMVYHQKKDQWRWEPQRSIVARRGEVVHERSAERAARSYGVDDYLAKPFTPTTLLTVVKDTLARGQRPDREEKEEE